MEKYIKKFNHNVLKEEEKKQKFTKNLYLTIGSIVLSIGALGFLASFIMFMVLFFDFKTDEAMMAWVIAVPFILMIVAGAVVTRVGDMLLKDFVEEEYQRDLKTKEEKESKKTKSQTKQLVEEITLKKEEPKRKKKAEK